MIDHLPDLTRAEKIGAMTFKPHSSCYGHDF